MTRPLMDWSDPHKTPRLPSSPDVAARQGGGVSPATPRPLSFWHSGGDVVWRGMNFLSLDEARDVRQIIIDELTHLRMSGGGETGAIGLLVEINTAINAARRWRQAQGAA